MPNGGEKESNTSKSGLCMTALAMALRMTPYWSTSWSSAASRPMKAWRKPMIKTTKSAKKMNDSFIMTLSTTSIAPKKRNVSR